MHNPIYDELADQRGVDVPEDPIDWFTPTPALEQTVAGTSAATGVEYAGYRYHPAPAVRPELVDVPERPDGWCENRPTDQLTDLDAVD